MNPNPAKAVIFDLDGVLVNTGPFHKQSWCDLAALQGWKFSDEIFRRTFGMQNNLIIPTLAGADLPPDRIEKLADWKEQRYRDLIAGKLTLLDGVRDLIDNLKTAGFLLAVGTSTPLINLEFVLEHTRIRHRFNAFVTSDDTSCGKPAPDTFLKAASKLNVPPENCVVVEDAVPGVQAAKTAGMSVLAVTTTRARADLNRADRIIDSLAEVSPADFDKLLSPLD